MVFNVCVVFSLNCKVKLKKKKKVTCYICQGPLCKAMFYVILGSDFGLHP